MGELIDLLVFRLSDKGVDSTHVPRVIKDVLNIVKDGEDFTVSSVNNRLESLGWGEGIVDEFVFELILSLLENQGDYQVERNVLH